MLAGVDPLAVSPAARVELLVQLERHAAWVESLRLSVVAAVAGPGPDYSVADAQLVDVADPLWDVQMVQDSIRDELAAALHISGRTAQRRIDLAQGPGTQTAAHAGFVACRVVHLRPSGGGGAGVWVVVGGSGAVGGEAGVGEHRAADPESDAAGVASRDRVDLSAPTGGVGGGGVRAS